MRLLNLVIAFVIAISQIGTYRLHHPPRAVCVDFMLRLASATHMNELVQGHPRWKFTAAEIVEPGSYSSFWKTEPASQTLVSIYLEEKRPAKQQPYGYDFSGSAKDAAQGANVGSGSTPVGVLRHKLRLLVELKPENVIIMVEDSESNGLEFDCKMLCKGSHDLRVLVLALTIKDHRAQLPAR